MNGCPKDCIANTAGPMQDCQTCIWWHVCVNVYNKRSLSSSAQYHFFSVRQRQGIFLICRSGLVVWHISLSLVYDVILCLQLAAVALTVVSILAKCRFIAKRWLHEGSSRPLSCFFIRSLFPCPWYCQITSGCCTTQGFLGGQSWRETVVLQSSQEGEYLCVCVISCFFLHVRKKEHIPCPFLPPWDHSTRHCVMLSVTQPSADSESYTRACNPLVFTPLLPFSCKFWAKPNTQVNQFSISKQVTRDVSFHLQLLSLSTH